MGNSTANQQFGFDGLNGLWTLHTQGGQRTRLCKKETRVHKLVWDVDQTKYPGMAERRIWEQMRCLVPFQAPTEATIHTFNLSYVTLVSELLQTRVEECCTNDWDYWISELCWS